MAVSEPMAMIDPSRPYSPGPLSKTLVAISAMVSVHADVSEHEDEGHDEDEVRPALDVAAPSGSGPCPQRADGVSRLVFIRSRATSTKTEWPLM